VSFGSGRTFADVFARPSAAANTFAEEASPSLQPVHCRFAGVFPTTKRGNSADAEMAQNVMVQNLPTYYSKISLVTAVSMLQALALLFN